MKYIWMLMFSLVTLGMTLYVLLSGESTEPVSGLQDLTPQTDSLEAAWVMVRDSVLNKE